MQQVHKRQDTINKNREIRHRLANESAAASIGALHKGFNIFCLNKGQYSIINVVEHTLNQIGKADVIISTWTAAGAEISKAKFFLESTKINRLHWIVDRSFPTRQPQYFKQLTAIFGEDCISMTNSHAKFIMLSNDDFKIVIRTSMNLNENKRLEYFEMSDDAALFDYFAMIADDVITMPFNPRNFERLGEGDKYSAFKPEMQNQELQNIQFDFEPIQF